MSLAATTLTICGTSWLSRKFIFCENIEYIARAEKFLENLLWTSECESSSSTTSTTEAPEAIKEAEVSERIEVRLAATATSAAASAAC